MYSRKVFVLASFDIDSPRLTQKNPTLYEIHGTQNDRLEITASACIFWDILVNISLPSTYSLKPIIETMSSSLLSFTPSHLRPANQETQN